MRKRRDRRWRSEEGAALTWAGAAPARRARAGPGTRLHGRSLRSAAVARSRRRSGEARTRSRARGGRRGRAEGAGPGPAT